MRLIPGGTFQMGSTNPKMEADHGGENKPVHSVTVSAFFMDRTLASYQALMGLNPSYFNTDALAPLRPVENVTWFDAVLYCNARSKRDGYDSVYSYSSIAFLARHCNHLSNLKMDFTRHGYRLPTEAEWEYACRAGTTTDYYWGQSYPPLTSADTAKISAHAWWHYNSSNGTQPVATKPPNAWGLYDMSGNVMEWCNDWQGNYSVSSQTNPTGPSNGRDRVRRGGSWLNDEGADYLCAAFRIDATPSYGCDCGGFRCIRR